MVWSRKRWLRSSLIGLGIWAAPLGASTVLAQPIDPFRPLISQYDAYRYPIGPATPEGGQSASMALGVRGANQFQNYLDELQGLGRDGGDRPALRLGGRNLAVIGHLPHLAVFAGWLIGSKKAQLDLAKAGVASISCPDEPSKGTGTLRWLVTLEWFTDKTG